MARCASESNDSGTLLAWDAYTMVISTACAAPAARAAKTPPRFVIERHDSATGTSVTFSFCGQGPTALPPRSPATFAPTNVPMSLVITMAAFLAAATSAVIE